MADVSLNAGIRANLLALQQSSELFNRTTGRLASGKRINSAVDNPTNYFSSVALTDRADLLQARLDGMGQATQQIKAADTGITSIRSFLGAMKGIINNALGNTNADARETLGRQFNELIIQIRTTADDSGYQGINLLRDNETAVVQFNETFDESTLNIKGFNIGGPGDDNKGEVDANGNVETAGGMGGAITIIGAGGTETTGAAALAIGVQYTDEILGIQSAQIGTNAVAGAVDWKGDDYKANLAAVMNQIENYDEVLKAQAGSLSQNLATVMIREEFTTKLVNTLNEGSDKLILADLNEEGANLLALQTSNQLATQSLSLASVQSQQVLQLLG